MRLIDADALIEKLEAWKEEAERMNANINYAFAVEVIAQVKAAPTIEERKTGKWEHGRETSREYQGKMLSKIWYEDWHCSVCGIVIERSEKPMYKFCPSCGADMREQP